MSYRECCGKKVPAKTCDCKRIIDAKQSQIQKLRNQLKLTVLINRELAGKSTNIRSSDGKEKIDEMTQKLAVIQEERRASEQSLQEQIFFLRKANDNLNNTIKEQSQRFDTILSSLREQSGDKQSQIDQLRNQLKIQENNCNYLHTVINQLEESNTGLKIKLLEQESEIDKQLNNNRSISGQIEQLIAKRSSQPRDQHDTIALHSKFAEISRQNLEGKRRNEELIREIERLSQALKDVNKRELQFNAMVYELKKDKQSAEHELQMKSAMLSQIKRELLQLKHKNLRS